MVDRMESRTAQEALAFCEAVLAHLLVFHGDSLPEPIKSRGFEAIKRAKPFLQEVL